ncbi:MAG TPA: GDSL-type esterase/lipase family protein [Pseudonocardiaceae bacterium]|jgi:lysophospholipase L1-like esterase|nr:GDSL-type esterase/lipase family protein [Pseudonocardiaceae bacterium]
MGVRDVRICVLGDSYVVGVGDLTGQGWVGHVALAARLRRQDLTVYNLGVRHDTSVDVSRRWFGEVRSRLKDGDVFGVVFAFGLNDVDVRSGERRVPRSRTLAVLGKMLDDAHGARWATFVVGPPPVADIETMRRIDDLATGMGEVCAAREVPFADVTAALSCDEIWSQEVAAGDAYHPSTRGYERLAALLKDPLLLWLNDQAAFRS